MTEKIQATLYLHAVNMLSDYRRKSLADWLRKQADTLQEDGRNYASRFRARYFTQSNEVMTMATKKPKKKSPVKKTGY